MFVISIYDIKSSDWTLKHSHKSVLNGQIMTLL